jgi:signal peptidase I
VLFFKNKKKKIEKKPGEIINPWREYPEMIIEVLVFVFFINTFLLQSQAIPTPSMINTMMIGDHLLVNKVLLAPKLGEWDSFMFPQIEIKRGMIVTFKGPAEMEKDYVKRVIGLPGETIRIRNKKVYINGKPLDEPYTFYKEGYRIKMGDHFPLQRPRILDGKGTITYLPFYMNDKSGHLHISKTWNLCKQYKENVIQDEAIKDRVFKIPEGHYFCMGDNRDNSYDSRFWGPLPREYMIGKPWRVYWSYESKTEEYLTPGFLHKVKDFFLTAIRFFTRTRWERTGKKFD